MVESLGQGRYRVSIGSQRHLACAVVDRGRTWVFVEGRTFVIDHPDTGAPARDARPDEGLALSAPMPATVIAVQTTPGQQVAAGDTLIMLEAMKMELPIKAPRTARVKAINCREGQLVQAGAPLVELEP